MAVQRKSLCVALLGLLTFSFVLLGGCGGGGGGSGGGGGGGGSDSLRLVSNMLIGTSGPGGTFTTPYPTEPNTFVDGSGIPLGSPPSAWQVAQPVFAPAAIGDQSFIELNFNTTVRASSVASDPPTGFDGIVLFVTFGMPDPTPPCVLQAGSPVCMRLDVNGLLNPSNLVVGDVAPATLRLYYDPDGNILTPDALPAGDYALVITNNLKTSNGGPFCVGNGSANCVNSYLPTLPFTIGSDTTAQKVSATTPIVPVSGEAAAPINSEIIINFVDAVDVGSAAGGQANLTTRDPFISIPFTFGGAIQPNLSVMYTAPIDPVTLVQQTLPASLGYVIYMPDPILNPAQLRIRFVNVTNLQPLDNPGAMIYQNYASDNKFPIHSSDPSQSGAVLQLPPIQPVPGSFLGSNLQIGLATVTVSMNQMVTDRALLPGGMANPLDAAFMSSFNWAVGPALSRNPVPPDEIVVGSLQGGPAPFDKPGITVVNTAHTTGSNTAVPCTNVPAWTGAPVTGVLTLMPVTSRIANLAVLGVPGDLEFGSFLNPLGLVTDSPRGTIVPGVLDDQNGMAPSGILNCINQMIPPPAPPYGNRLYVTDTTSGSLKVFNSYDFTLIATVPGVASPRGLGIAPDLNFVYVSNSLQGTIQRINANPASPNFHTITNTITVGNGPRAISVQPANEDVLVCNFAENTLSLVRVGTQMERARMTTGLGPSDVFVTRRMIGMGLTNEYLAFIPNVFSNTVSVYESAGGLVVLENLPQGRMIAAQSGFLGPARGTWNWLTYLALGPGVGPGCFVANSFGSSVDRMALQSFTLSPPPGFPGPAGSRIFTVDPIASGVGASPSDVSIDNMSGMYNFNVAGFTNNKAACDPSVGAGVPSVLVVAYPGLGKCIAYDYNSPALYAEVSVPGCDFLQAYYDQ